MYYFRSHINMVISCYMVYLIATVSRRCCNISHINDINSSHLGDTYMFINSIVIDLYNSLIYYNKFKNAAQLLTQCDLVTPYGSTLNQVMLWATSHYLNQCWLMISVVVLYPPEDKFTRNAQDIYPWHEFEHYWFKITAACPRSQWVNIWPPLVYTMHH